MCEWFVSAFRTEYPDCRFAYQGLIERKCFVPCPDDDEECEAEPCPVQRYFLFCRCSIKDLDEGEIELFRKKSSIDGSRNYALISKAEIVAASPEEQYKHHDLLQEFEDCVTEYETLPFGKESIRGHIAIRFNLSLFARDGGCLLW